MSLRHETDFINHIIVPSFNFEDVDKLHPDNIILKTDDARLKWIEESTLKIGNKWRSSFRSTYIRWALAINGLNLAETKYSDTKWKEKNEFYVQSLRGKAELKPIAVWNGDFAAKAHHDTINVMVAFSIIDMYSCFEAFIFDLFRIYWNHNPSKLLKGNEYKELRFITK